MTLAVVLARSAYTRQSIMPMTAESTQPAPATPPHGESLLSCPDPVNEVSARLVAGGPTLSPLGRLVTRMIVPRLPTAARPVPGPPKRFSLLMRVGAMPPEVCERCAHLTGELPGRA
jgi:hypothetical protein